MPFNAPKLEEVEAYLAESFLEFMKSRPAPNPFGFLSVNDVLRAPLCRARLGLRWDEAMAGSPADLVCAALAKLHAPACLKSLVENAPEIWRTSAWQWLRFAIRRIAETNDPAWAKRVFEPGSCGSPEPSAYSRPARNEEVEVEVVVKEARLRVRREWYTRTYEGPIQLDKAKVIELLVDDDEDGLEELLNDEINDQYYELSEEDGDPDDAETDDDEATGDGWELAGRRGFSGMIADLREALAEEIDAAIAERDAEEEADDDAT